MLQSAWQEKMELVSKLNTFASQQDQLQQGLLIEQQKNAELL